MDNNLKITNKSEGKSFLNYFLPLYPILQQYSGPIVSLGLTIVVCFSAIVLLKRKTLVLYRPFMVFISFAIIMQIAHGFILPENITTYNAGNLEFMLVILFIVVSTWGLIDTNCLYRAYKFFGVIVLAVVMIQSFQLYVLGQSVNPWAFIDIKDQKFWYQFGNRPSAFFTEPQALCSFLFPLLFLSLKKKEKLFSLFIVLACILSTSSLGIIISLIMVAVDIFIVGKDVKAKTFATFILLLGVFVLILNTELVASSYTIQKILNISITDDVRLARGFAIYAQFPLDKQLIGVGLGNVPDYLAYASNIRFDWMNLVRQDAWGYSNAIAGSLFSFGIFGGVLFVYFLLSLRKYCSKAIVPMYIAILMLTISTSIILDSWFIFFFVFFFGVLSEEGKIKTTVFTLSKKEQASKAVLHSGCIR